MALRNALQNSSFRQVSLNLHGFLLTGGIFKYPEIYWMSQNTRRRINSDIHDTTVVDAMSYAKTECHSSQASFSSDAHFLIISVCFILDF